MNSKNKIVSLRQVPGAVFSEFSISDEPQQHGEFKTELGDEYSVSICLAQESGKNGPFTLAYKDKKCRYGRFHRTEFLVYNHPLRLIEFEPKYEGFQFDPEMTIYFSADDPPYNPRPSFDTPKWQSGKGYWVDEHLTVWYGGGTRYTNWITSQFEDWEFGFLLKVQQFAYELARGIINRGHWQNEWNPTGDFRVKPERTH